MSTVQPPRLALALLNRFVPDDEPLIGDLVEEFQRRRSRSWLWRQVLVAVAIRLLPTSRQARPRMLGAMDSTLEPHLARGVRSHTVNITGSPVPGIGGLGIVIFGFLITAVRPEAWVAVACAAAGGIVLAVAMVIGRRRGLSAASGDNHILFKQ